MLNIDLRNKSYKQFFVKNETRVAREKFIFDFFFQLKIFWSSFSSKF